MSCSLYGNYRTRSFSDIFPDYDTFGAFMATMVDFTEEPLGTKESQMLYYTLASRYKDSHIADSDEDHFKLEVWAIINEHGPTWARKLSIQKTLRGLTEADIVRAGKTIMNTAANPSTTPTTEEIEQINEQITNTSKRAVADAYDMLYSSLKDNLTGAFMDKFKPLFLTVVLPEYPLWYESEE